MSAVARRNVTCVCSLPAHCKSPRRIQESGGVGGERASNGEENCHFAQRMDRCVEHNANEGKRDQKRGRSSRFQRLAASNEQASADRASDGNHLQMAALQRPLQRRSGSVLDCGLDIVDSAVGAEGAFRGGVGVGVSPEAVDDAGAEGALVLGVLAVSLQVARGGGREVGPAQALFRALHGGVRWGGGVCRRDALRRRYEEGAHGM